MAGGMDAGEPYPLGVTAMNYATTRISAPSWRTTRARYSQRRLMLWSHVAPQLVDVGRRFMPPSEPSAGTQPGRERPHPRRCVPDPSALQGVAHVPAAKFKQSAHSARGRLVLCTSESRPTYNSPIVAQGAPLSDEVQRLVSA